MASYLQFLDQHSLDIAAFRARQQHAFATEIARWKDHEAAVASKPASSSHRGRAGGSRWASPPRPHARQRLEIAGQTGRESRS